jgi:taurine dioxygenase
VEIVPIDGPLGAEIKHIDLSQDNSEEERKAIFDAYIDRSVLLFRDQRLSYDDLLRLREYFGPACETVNQLLGLGRKKYYTDDIPTDITIISNIVDNGRQVGSLGSSELSWHSDSSFTEVPISASLLHAVEVPNEGGETAFLNMYQAYDDLPEDLRKQAEGKLCNQSQTHSPNGVKRPEYKEVTDVRDCPGVKHPLVRIHPTTKKKCLYLGLRQNAYVIGLSVDESEELLDRLWAHACQDKYVWEHKWRVGDLVVWDNRCTMHHRKAFPDNARRLMHKSITAGEPVIAA